MAKSIELTGERARGLAVLRELLRSMRPKDWIKNVFVFAAIAFSTQNGLPHWLNPYDLGRVIVGFVLFCMVASAIYLINDLVDIEKDRAHPKKRYRPLASGRLSPVVARAAAVLLLVIALPTAFLLDYQPGDTILNNLNFGAALTAYLLIQGIAYSYYLKHLVLIDVFTIAAGFVLRAVAGAMVIDIQITPWLLVCMGLLALFLGLAKRRAELVLLESGAGEHRRILEEYSLPLIDQLMSIVTAATIIAYALFTFTADTLPTKPFPTMMITVPLVVYAIFRYLYLIYKHGGGGSPAELILKDMPLAISLIVYGLTSLAILAAI